MKFPNVLALAALATFAVSCKSRTMNENKESATRSNSNTKPKFSNVTFIASRAIPMGSDLGVCFYAATTRVHENWFIYNGGQKADDYDDLFATAWKRMRLVKAYANPESLQEGRNVNLAQISRTPGRRDPLPTKFVSVDAIGKILANARGVGPTAGQRVGTVARTFVKETAKGTLSPMAAVGAGMMFAPITLLGTGAVMIASVSNVSIGDSTPKEAIETALDAAQKLGRAMWDFSVTVAQVSNTSIEELASGGVPLDDRDGILKKRHVDQRVGDYLQNLAERTKETPVNEEDWQDTDAADNVSIARGEAAFSSRLALQHLVSMANKDIPADAEVPLCPDTPEEDAVAGVQALP